MSRSRRISSLSQLGRHSHQILRGRVHQSYEPLRGIGSTNVKTRDDMGATHVPSRVYIADINLLNTIVENVPKRIEALVSNTRQFQSTT